MTEHPDDSTLKVPDCVPARMLNEFVYLSQHAVRFRYTSAFAGGAISTSERTWPH